MSPPNAEPGPAAVENGCPADRSNFCPASGMFGVAVTARYGAKSVNSGGTAAAAEEFSARAGAFALVGSPLMLPIAIGAWPGRDRRLLNGVNRARARFMACCGLFDEKPKYVAAAVSKLPRLVIAWVYFTFSEYRALRYRASAIGNWLPCSGVRPAFARPVVARGFHWNGLKNSAGWVASVVTELP